MDVSVTFTHRPVTMWHPAMLVAVIPIGMLGWTVGARLLRAVLVLHGWRRTLTLLVVVPTVSAAVGVLTFLAFSLVWERIEGPTVFVSFGIVNRFALLAPVAAFLTSVVREWRRGALKRTAV